MKKELKDVKKLLKEKDKEIQTLKKMSDEIDKELEKVYAEQKILKLMEHYYKGEYTIVNHI